MQEALEEQQEPTAPGVHDTCLLEDRQELRRAIQRVLGPTDHAAHGLDEILALAVRDLGLFGRLPDDREDRPLLRLHDGLVGEIGSRAQAALQRVGVKSVRRAHRFGQPPEDLRQDDAGVARARP